MITPVCFGPICEMSCIFLLQLNITKRRHVFLALGVRKPKNKSNQRNTKCALTCSLQKATQALMFRASQKIDISFYYKMVFID